MDKAYTLKNTERITFDELDALIVMGAKFIVYQYTISLFAVTLKRLTPAYYVPVGVSSGAYKGRANWLSILFGWWAIPYGPMYTIQSLLSNRKGIDVTKDIMANLTKEDFEQNKVILAVIYSPYHTPNKTETECLRKSLRTFIGEHSDIKEAYFGLYVNVQNRQEPFFVVGLPHKYLDEIHVVELKKILYKSFNKNAHFEFIDMDADDELSNKLIELGLKETSI